MYTVNNEVLVSIICDVFNHSNFIEDCLNGFLIQETNFKFEILIHDDASTDDSQQIIKKYENKYPDIIKPIYQEENQYSKGIGIWEKYQLPRAKGKYIAVCEGDDYWIDPLKLQKQVDFLEANSSFVLCATRSKIDMYGTISIGTITKDVLDTRDILLEDWSLMTATLMFRKSSLNLPNWYHKVKNGDYSLQLLLSLNGRIKILQDVTSVYRIHGNGVSSKLTAYVQCAWMVFLLSEFNSTTNSEFYPEIKQKIKKVFKNQMQFAKKYNLRRAYMELLFFNLFRPISPFLIKNFR